MTAERVPAGPWRWEKVIPDAPGGAVAGAGPRGEALVASDGTWLLSFDSGRGVPEVNPAVKDLLARAWLLRPPAEPGAYAFDCDLIAWDETCNWTLLTRSQWDPTIIYPGATLWAGRPGAAAELQVLRTELFLTDGTVMLLVSFRQTAILSLEAALSGD